MNKKRKKIQKIYQMIFWYGLYASNDVSRCCRLKILGGNRFLQHPSFLAVFYVFYVFFNFLNNLHEQKSHWFLFYICVPSFKMIFP
jgi:hypothetical protein